MNNSQEILSKIFNKHRQATLLMKSAPDTFFDPETVIEHFKIEAKKASDRLLTCFDLKARRELIGKRDFSLALVNYTKVAQLFEVEKSRKPEGEKEEINDQNEGAKIIQL
jgi:hypothetical protein